MTFEDYSGDGLGYRFHVGVDLGQARDPSALAVIRERITVPTARNGLKEETTSLELAHLDRFGINMSYPDQITHIQRTLARAPLCSWGSVRVGFDATGVGRAVSDMALKKGLNHTPVTITAGDGFSRDGNSRRVSKSMLVGSLLTAMHDNRLRISTAIPFAETLKKELSDFRVTYTDAGNATFNAREGAHDDLVLAVALAHWMKLDGGNGFTCTRAGRFAMA